MRVSPTIGCVHKSNTRILSNERIIIIISNGSGRIDYVHLEQRAIRSPLFNACYLTAAALLACWFICCKSICATPTHTQANIHRITRDLRTSVNRISHAAIHCSTFIMGVAIWFVAGFFPSFSLFSFISFSVRDRGVNWRILSVCNMHCATESKPEPELVRLPPPDTRTGARYMLLSPFDPLFCIHGSVLDRARLIFGVGIYSMWFVIDASCTLRFAKTVSCCVSATCVMRRAISNDSAPASRICVSSLIRLRKLCVSEKSVFLFVFFLLLFSYRFVGPIDTQRNGVWISTSSYYVRRMVDHSVAYLNKNRSSVLWTEMWKCGMINGLSNPLPNDIGTQHTLSIDNPQSPRQRH